MKKIVGCFNIFIIVLFLANCEHPTFNCIIENTSDYPAELSLSFSKLPQDTVSLNPKKSITVAFYYTGNNVKLVSKNYNILEKISESKYVIKNLQPQTYKIHNLLPIDITVLDNGKNILADKDTQKSISNISIPCGNYECYFFRNIEPSDIVLQTDIEKTVDSIKYSVKKIAGFYFLEIIKTLHPTEKHKIIIDVSAENIIISY